MRSTRLHDAQMVSAPDPVPRSAGAVKSAGRVLQVLEFFEDVRRPARATEISEALGLKPQHPEGGGAEVLIDERGLTDADNAVVTYHNPLDNVPDLARHFFSRCLEAEVVPYVVTKKTVFKWQEGFWAAMKKVFDAEFKAKYTAAGLLDGVGGELPHLISDAATMQILSLIHISEPTRPY